MQAVPFHADFASPSIPDTPEVSNTTTNDTTVSTDARLPKPLEHSGLATLSPPLSDTMLLYYQMENGSVIEVSFPPANLDSASSNITNYNWTIVADGIDLRSPLASTSWIDPTSNTYIVGLDDTAIPESNRSLISGLASTILHPNRIYIYD